MICKKLNVTLYEKGTLNSRSTSVNYNGIKISIVDFGNRVISLESSYELDITSLFLVFCNINSLCMLGEGYFYDIEELKFEDSISSSEEQLRDVSKETIEKNMLDYYKMNADFLGDKLFLLPIHDYINENILNNWIALEEELIYPNNAFRYMTHIKGLPLDLRTTYITECFEPLAVYISNKTKESIPKINRRNGNRRTLLECLTYIISRYGDECFLKEKTNHETDCRIKQLVNNRDKIMHLKRDMDGRLLLTENDTIIYSRKLQLLYRHALLQLTGVDKTKYKTKLEQCVNFWNSYAI